MSNFDLSDIGEGLSYLTESLSDIDNTQRSGGLDKERKKAIAEAKQTESDVNTNMGMMASPLQAHQQPQAMVGTPTSQVEARRRTAVDTQAKDTITQAKEDEEYKSKMNGQIQWRTGNKDASWDDMPLDLYAGTQGQRAYATLISQEADTEEGKTTIRAGRAAKSQEAYGNFENIRGYVNEAIKQGDLTKAVNGMQRMTKDLPLPYQLGEFDRETQTFSVQYLDSPSGEFKETQRMGLQEVLTQMNQTGEKQFVTQLAFSFENIKKANDKKRMEPMYGTRQDGRRFIIISQKEVLNPGQVHIEVRDEKTNEKTMYNSWAEVQEAGITVEDLGREKALKGLNVQDQQIATSKAAMRNSDRSNQDGDIKKSTAMTKQFKADLSFVLTPFTKPGTELFDADGGMSSQGKGALEAAMSFYEKNNAAEDLSKTDQMKLEKAKSAIQLYNGMSQNIISQYDQKQPGGPAGKDSAPVPGAKKSKDGYWYVPQGQGWAKVEVSDEDSLNHKKAGAETAMSQTPGEVVQPDPTPNPAPQPQIRPGLPQDISQWNVQILPQNGKRVPVVITENGPISLTPEELDMYKQFSSQQRDQAIGSGMNWFKENATGTQSLK